MLIRADELHSLAEMAKTPISPMPDSFASEHERDFWHSAQDIAFRAGKSLVYREGATWLVSPGDETLVCKPDDPERIWWKTLIVLKRDYPLLYQVWIGGHPRGKPGDEHRRAKRKE